MDPVNINISSVNYRLSKEEETSKSSEENTIGVISKDVLTKQKDEQTEIYSKQQNSTETPIFSKKYDFIEKPLIKFSSYVSEGLMDFAQTTELGGIEENSSLAPAATLEEMRALEKYELDIDLKMEEELDGMLTSNSHTSILCEMPADSIFLDTDLIILKDEYKGSMPINGIKEKDFKEISLLFNNICAGNSKIKINKSAPEFLTAVKEAIKTLLTREIGRNLLTKICQRESDLFILLDPSAVDAAGFARDFSSIIIDPSLVEKASILELHPSGKLQSRTQPLYLHLGHELIHASHEFDSSRLLPTLGKNYDDMEEQITIVGSSQELSLETDSDDMEKPVNHKNYYNELNERNLTAAFTGGKNIWYPRSGHEGIIIKEKGDLKRHITQLILLNVQYDLEKFFEYKIINIDELLFPNSALSIALETGNIDLLKFLIKKDPSAVHTKVNGLSLFLQAQLRQYDTSTYLSVLETLHEAKADINATDPSGNGPLCYMLVKDLNEGVKKFLEWGGDTHLKNKMGKTAVEQACECAVNTVNPSSLSNLYENVKLIAGENYIFDHQPQLLQNILDYCDPKFSLSVFESYYTNQQITKDHAGNTLLHYMVSSGNLEGVKRALELERALELDSTLILNKNNQGLTPMELMIERLNLIESTWNTPEKKEAGQLVLANIMNCLEYFGPIHQHSLH